MNRNRAVLLALLAAFVFTLAPAASAQVQVPLSPTKIPQFVQPLDTPRRSAAGRHRDLRSGGTAIDLSICEFQTNILPPGTVRQGSPAPATWVWGYQVGTALPRPGLAAARSYLGPVVIAERGMPDDR